MITIRIETETQRWVILNALRNYAVALQFDAEKTTHDRVRDSFLNTAKLADDLYLMTEEA